MKKASAKVRRKVKTKFVQSISKLQRIYEVKENSENRNRKKSS